MKAIVLPAWLPLTGDLTALKEPLSTPYKVDEQTHEYLCVVGWFFYKEKLNDIDTLFEDISKIGEEALKGITAGVFYCSVFKPSKLLCF